MPDNLPDTIPAIVLDEAPVASTPNNLNTVFLGGIFILVLFATLFAAKDIMMPVVLAFVLKLVLQPLLRFLENLRVPRALAAIIILVALGSVVMALGSALSGPSSVWIEKFADNIPKLQERLGFLSRPISQAQKFIVHADNLTKGSGPQVVPVALEGNRLSDKIFTGTRALAGGMFTTVLVLFFLLISGDTFLRRLVEVLPRFNDKRQVVDISQQIERDISGYLLTITTMNALVGIATAIVVQVTGLGDPELWGTMAFLLNYIPIIGPLIGVVILLLAGLMANIDGAMFLPAVLYLAVHIAEGTMITPLLLARRFTLNPVLVILSLVFWYWMWGIPGAILAMPMLAIAKIICDRIQPLMAFGHFLEG